MVEDKNKTEGQAELNFEMSELTITLKRWLNYFLSGIAILLPLIITVLIVGWVINLLNRLVGSESFLGGALRSIGNVIPVHPTVFVVFGYVFIIVGIGLLGYLLKGVARRQLEFAIKNFVVRIPIIGKIYASSEQVISLLKESKKHEGGTTLGKGVIVTFANLKVFGFLTSDTAFDFDKSGVKHYLVFVPSAPVPATGFLYYIPEKDIVHTDLKFEEMSKVLASMGLLAPKVLPPKFIAK